MKKTLLEVATILFLALALSLIHNALSGHRIKLFLPAKKESAKVFSSLL